MFAAKLIERNRTISRPADKPIGATVLTAGWESKASAKGSGKGKGSASITTVRDNTTWMMVLVTPCGRGEFSVASLTCVSLGEGLSRPRGGGRNIVTVFIVVRQQGWADIRMMTQMSLSSEGIQNRIYDVIRPRLEKRSAVFMIIKIGL